MHLDGFPWLHLSWSTSGSDNTGKKIQNLFKTGKITILQNLTRAFFSIVRCRGDKFIAQEQQSFAIILTLMSRNTTNYKRSEQCPLSMLNVKFMILQPRSILSRKTVSLHYLWHKLRNFISGFTFSAVPISSANGQIIFWVNRAGRENQMIWAKTSKCTAMFGGIFFVYLF